MDFFFFIRVKISRSQAQIQSSPAFMLESESAHARGTKCLVVSPRVISLASFACLPVDHSTSIDGRREATSRRRPCVDFSQTPLFAQLHPKSGRGTRMARVSVLATTESLAETTAMKTKLNIEWSGEISVASHDTDRSHRLEKNILPGSFPGEGNACLPPARNFNFFKSKTGRWRSIGGAKWRKSLVRLALFNPIAKHGLS